jgi:hypothetical protein
MSAAVNHAKIHRRPMLIAFFPLLRARALFTQVEH